MIKIGVTPSMMHPDPNRSVFCPKTLACFEMDMAEYLYQFDAYPILIPAFTGKRLEDFLAEIDGIVYQGGVDVSPTSYNADYLDKSKWPGDPITDKVDLEIMSFASEQKLPVFAICRGAQIVNCFFNGTLHQDLETIGKNKHRDKEAYDTLHHQVDFIENELLEQIYQHSSNRTINSIHHQGIDKLGDNLVPLAHSEQDKIIEAYRYHDMNEHYILAVQWHPEFSNTLKDKVISPEPLYKHFIDAIARK